MRQVLGLALLVLVGAWGFTAPAPTPRKAPVKVVITPPHVGVWAMTWKGCDYPTSFEADGGYTCDVGGSPWVGEWTLLGGSLKVREWPLFGEGFVLEWEVTLDATGRAGTCGGSPFLLAQGE